MSQLLARLDSGAHWRVTPVRFQKKRRALGILPTGERAHL
jgi:hypothetical protein